MRSVIPSIAQPPSSFKQARVHNTTPYLIDDTQIKMLDIYIKRRIQHIIAEKADQKTEFGQDVLYQTLKKRVEKLEIYLTVAGMIALLVLIGKN